MTDITERLRDAARIHVELAGQSALAATINAGADEIERLRARLNTAGHAHLDGAHLSRKADGCLLCEAMTERETLRARVAELEAAKYGSNPSMVLLDEVHANGVDVDAIPISRLIAALDVLHRRVQERDDDGAATPGDMRAALRAIFNKGE